MTLLLPDRGEVGRGVDRGPATSRNPRSATGMRNTGYPRVSPNVPQQAGYRDPDAVQGGTWEAFERILEKRGYFKNGLRKIEAARAIAPNIDPARNRSRSFAAFRNALIEATA